MRFVIIEPRCRKAFDVNAPYQITEDYIRSELACDELVCIPLDEDVDLWVSADPKRQIFRMLTGAQYSGRGLICGRTLLGECKGLPRRITLESINALLDWPQPRALAQAA